MYFSSLVCVLPKHQHSSEDYLRAENLCLMSEHIWDSLVAQVVKNLPAMQETWIQSLGWKDSPGEGNGNSHHYSYLDNSMDRGAWLANVPGLQRVGHN